MTHVHEGAAFGVPRGLLVLEAQDELVGYVCTVVAAILETAMNDIQPNPDFHRVLKVAKNGTKRRRVKPSQEVEERGFKSTTPNLDALSRSLQPLTSTPLLQ